MKRFTLGLIVFLLINVPVQAQSSPIPFQDHEDHIYEEAIEFLYTEGIIEGYPNYTFQPDKDINRAELLKVIVESNFEESEYSSFADDSCFPDVPSTEWFAQYICFAKSRRIIEGYPDGYFRPEQTINLVESLKIIYEGIGLAIPNPTVTFKFRYYSPAYKSGYIPDELVGGFSDLMTRGEISEIMYRILIDDEKEMKEEVNLNLTIHKQEYYASCGTAALATALSKQVSVSEDEVIERMIDIGIYPDNELVLEEDNYVWDDPQKVFVGDYNGIVSINMGKLAGFGFLETPLEILAREWAPDSEKFSNSNVVYVAQQLEEGYPVIVFANVGAYDGEVILTEPGAYTVTWQVRDDGRMLTVPMYKHNLVIEGFKGTAISPEVFYVIDPFYGKKLEMTPFELENVLAGYNFSGVVIKF